ncbi:hypothetical protein F2Q69_00060351 [Brassica cretica]|uniref:Uncharacterized protein n=1 Tax=Brassica cretica TaxID=69181 RepID=A0A8S9RFC5_BRACR|nr:hypothetical protein F2Q69_00060351 [Brassica cretica]
MYTCQISNKINLSKAITTSDILSDLLSDAMLFDLDMRKENLELSLLYATLTVTQIRFSGSVTLSGGQDWKATLRVPPPDTRYQTGAFCIPVLEKIDPNTNVIQALITPQRLLRPDQSLCAIFLRPDLHRHHLLLTRRNWVFYPSSSWTNDCYQEREPGTQPPLCNSDSDLNQIQWLRYSQWRPRLEGNVEGPTSRYSLSDWSTSFCLQSSKLLSAEFQADYPLDTQQFTM